ncbi:MAG: MarR family transcriptional regulator [Mycobacteriaceae bacterium]
MGVRRVEDAMARDDEGEPTEGGDVHPGPEPDTDTDTDIDVAVLRLATFAVAATITAGAQNTPPLSATQVRVLVVLGAAPDGATLTQVAAALGASAPSASRLCRRLVDHGLLDRTAAEGNAINLRLSPTGRDTLRRVNASRLAQLRTLGDALPAHHRAAVAAAVRALADSDPPVI